MSKPFHTPSAPIKELVKEESTGIEDNPPASLYANAMIIISALALLDAFANAVFGEFCP